MPTSAEGPICWHKVAHLPPLVPFLGGHPLPLIPYFFFPSPPPAPIPLTKDVRSEVCPSHCLRSPPNPSISPTPPSPPDHCPNSPDPAPSLSAALKSVPLAAARGRYPFCFKPFFGFSSQRVESSLPGLRFRAFAAWPDRARPLFLWARAVSVPGRRSGFSHQELPGD